MKHLFIINPAAGSRNRTKEYSVAIHEICSARNLDYRIEVSSAPGECTRIAREAGLGGSADSIAVRNLRNGLTRLRKELKLPATLSQAGIDPGRVWRDTPAIVSAALADPCCCTNPVEVADFMVRKILDEVTGRG